MRFAIVLLLAIAAPAVLADEPAASGDKAADSAAEATVFKPPPGFSTKKRGALTLYCVKDSTVGTRFKTERCYDEDQVRDYIAAREEQKRNIDRIRNTCGSGTEACHRQ